MVPELWERLRAPSASLPPGALTANVGNQGDTRMTVSATSSTTTQQLPAVQQSCHMEQSAQVPPAQVQSSGSVAGASSGGASGTADAQIAGSGGATTAGGAVDATQGVVQQSQQAFTEILTQLKAIVEQLSRLISALVAQQTATQPPASSTTTPSTGATGGASGGGATPTPVTTDTGKPEPSKVDPPTTPTVPAPPANVGGANGGGPVDPKQQDPTQHDPTQCHHHDAKTPDPAGPPPIGLPPEVPIATVGGANGGGPVDPKQDDPKQVPTQESPKPVPLPAPDPKPLPTPAPDSKPDPAPDPKPEPLPPVPDMPTGGANGGGTVDPKQDDPKQDDPKQVPTQESPKPEPKPEPKPVTTVTLDNDDAVDTDKDGHRYSAQLTSSLGNSVELWGDPHVTIVMDGTTENFEIGYGPASFTTSSGHTISWDTNEPGQKLQYVLRNFRVDSAASVSTMDSKAESNIATPLTDEDLREFAAYLRTAKSVMNVPFNAPPPKASAQPDVPQGPPELSAPSAPPAP